MPLNLAVKVFDLFMLEQEKALFAVTINMLRIMKDKILAFESMVSERT